MNTLRGTANDDRFWKELCIGVLASEALPPACLAQPDSWLTGRERAELAKCQASTRRGEWLAGRYCAKGLLLSRGGAWRDWEVLSRRPNGLGQPPQVLRNGQRVGGCLTLSHSASLSVAAFLTLPEESVGVDVVDYEPTSSGFESMWFSHSEIVEMNRSGITPLEGWAVKEAAFKAARDGQSFRPRRMTLSHLTDACYRVDWSSGQTERDKAVEVRIVRTSRASIAFARCYSLARHHTFSQSPAMAKCLG